MAASSRKQRRRSVGLATSVAALVLLTTPSEATGPEEKFYSVKLHVNIYNGAGTTVEEVKAAVKRANEILKHAMVRLELTDACIRENVDIPGGNDGGLTAEERRTARKEGREEVAGEDGKGKGVKASFIMNPQQKDMDVNGLAVEGDPTIIMRENAAGNEKTAQTMAHEFGHVFGLRDLYDAGTEGSIMHGYSAERTGTALSEMEIATIKSNAKGFGNEISRKTDGAPAERTPEEHGAKANPAPTTPPGGSEKKIAFARINRLEGDPDYLINIEIDGIIPVTVPSRRYHVLFDFDNDTATGSTQFARPGINGQVVVIVNGENSITGFYQGFVPPSSAPVTITRFRGLECFNDEALAPPTQPTFSAEHDFLRILVPQNLLGFTNGDEFDVTVLAANTTDGVTDQFDVRFHRLFGDLGDIGLTTQLGHYRGGETALLAAHGFPPSSMANLFLDDTHIADLPIDESGSFSGGVELPIVAPNFYFLVLHTPSTRAAGAPAGDAFATTVITIAPPLCAGDADGDSDVDFNDILSTLANFGADYTPDTGPGDADGSGIVNFADILTTLANFGALCE